MNRKRIGMAALVAGAAAVVRRRMRTVADPGAEATVSPQPVQTSDPTGDSGEKPPVGDNAVATVSEPVSATATASEDGVDTIEPAHTEDDADVASPPLDAVIDAGASLGDPEITLPPAEAEAITSSLDSPQIAATPVEPVPTPATPPAVPAIVLPAMPLAGSTTIPNPVVHIPGADGSISRVTVPSEASNSPVLAVPDLPAQQMLAADVVPGAPEPVAVMEASPEVAAAVATSATDELPVFRAAGSPQAPPPPEFGADGAGSRPLARPSLWSILGSLLLALLVTAVVAASFVKLPYYRLEPGSVYDTIDRVEAPGDLVFLPEGEIGFVTVAQTANITAWQWLDAKLDDNVRIRHEDEVRGDQTADELREADQRRMQVSKSAAVVVALQRLGFDLIITPIGIEVAQVFPCTAAEGTLGTGDLIVGVNGVDVRNGEQLVEQLIGIGIDQEVELLVERIDPNNPTQSIRTDLVGLTLGSADDACLPDDVRADEPRPFIGIGTLTIFDEDLPVDVDIRTGSVGGPSAGLAFTLAIIDVLSDGELTNGLNIVATGSIDRGGNVGPVGGIHQKTIAAERSGADVFIVPKCCDNFVDRETGEPVDTPSNYEEALEHADEMIVIGVDTLDEALIAIGELGGDVDRFISSE